MAGSPPLLMEMIQKAALIPAKYDASISLFGFPSRNTMLLKAPERDRKLWISPCSSSCVNSLRVMQAV